MFRYPKNHTWKIGSWVGPVYIQWLNLRNIAITSLPLEILNGKMAKIVKVPTLLGTVTFFFYNFFPLIFFIFCLYFNILVLSQAHIRRVMISEECLLVHRICLLLSSTTSALVTKWLTCWTIIHIYYIKYQPSEQQLVKWIIHKWILLRVCICWHLVVHVRFLYALYLWKNLTESKINWTEIYTHSFVNQLKTSFRYVIVTTKKRCL